MSAISIQIYTLDIPNPEWAEGNPNGDAYRIPPNISFSQLEPNDIRTLSTTGAAGGTDVTGLLYTPDLDPTNACVNASTPFVPFNVTRRANLPQQDYPLVALAPWTSGACALAYMEVARMDPIRGFVFFLPNDDASIPPDQSDDVWDIQTAGNWKSDNGYPVYAIPGHFGQLYMEQSSLYSGNMTEVPFGHNLTEMYDSRDYVRLFADIQIAGVGSSLPSLWVFLLVVLAILLAIIGLTSLSMHLVQRRRRQSLRRRVANGEVDLEALGIKRLTVPQELLDTMPLYTYGTSQPSSRDVAGAEEKSSRSAPTLDRSSSYRPAPLSQPTCAICLDDYVPADGETPGTTVRELPCHHIFHPECVDTFLRDSSSLCPMCKKTALPKGYCPKAITNAMVRRERMVRQIRERVVVDPEGTEIGENDRRTPSRFSTFRSRARSGLRIGMSTTATDSQQMQPMGEPARSETANTATTATASPATSDPATSSSVPRIQPPSTPGRQEWARQRAVEMLGQRAPIDPDLEEASRTPAWRKAVRGIFPRR